MKVLLLNLNPIARDSWFPTFSTVQDLVTAHRIRPKLSNNGTVYTLPNTFTFVWWSFGIYNYLHDLERRSRIPVHWTHKDSQEIKFLLLYTTSTTNTTTTTNIQRSAGLLEKYSVTWSSLKVTKYYWYENYYSSIFST